MIRFVLWRSGARYGVDVYYNDTARDTWTFGTAKARADWITAVRNGEYEL